MPYILNKTNGAVLTTIGDASLDVSTSLTFVGRNYAGYGEVVNENFLKLLENFSNSTQPQKPILGQLWFNSNSDVRRLEVCYDGKNFKGIATIRVQTATPSSNIVGDLWWDTDQKQLKAFDGSSYILVGPPTSKAAKSSWEFEDEVGTDEGIPITYPLIKAKVGGTSILTVAKLASASQTFVPAANSDLKTGNINTQTIVKKGISLVGADPITGSSTSTGYYFWGTSAESLRSNTATNSTKIIVTRSPNVDANFYVPFVGGTTGSMTPYTTSTFYFNPSSNVLNVTASSSRYADLAEKYMTDRPYPVGTVVSVGGTSDVTACNDGDRAIGVVSENPAYMMNDGLLNGTYIALKGRVPVRIIGTVKKGDRLVAGRGGKAKAAFLGQTDVFAIALTDGNSSGVCEAVVL